MFRNWIKYTKDRKKDIQLASTLWRMGEYEHIKQTDNANCGVFVCYFFKMLINQDYGSLNRYFNPNEFRSTITENILENSRKYIRKFY